MNIGSLILLARLIAEQNRFRAEYRKLLQLRYKVRQAELRNSRRATPPSIAGGGRSTSTKGSRAS